MATSPPKRKLRNFLLDARFQLKFTSYVVGLTLLVAALMGVFLWRTTNILFRETEVAVEARSRAAETSKELSNATLANDLMQHMDDPAFEAQLREKSAAIDRAYEAEEHAIIEARTQLVHRQQVTLIALIGGLIAFVVFIGLGVIVSTHKIVGPLFRVKRMAQDVAEGKLKMPAYGLRPGDELKDLFEAFAGMIQALRNREEEDVGKVQAALQLAERTGASEDVIRELQTLQAQIKARLG
ncbi:MAG: HAMP domain-containing protein [Myxococcales bacterium]|nr:HAMP domain-containing protein [Myxococcales bacterium]